MTTLTLSHGDTIEALHIEPDGWGGTIVTSVVECFDEPSPPDIVYLTAEMWAAFVAWVREMPAPVAVPVGQLDLLNFEGTRQ